MSTPGPLAVSRAAGVLLHVSSLPSGRLGPPAREFVDWLAEAGQRWWQMLPLGPPHRSGSPYETRSAFAGWTGFLEHPDAAVAPEENEAFIAANRGWAPDWELFAGNDAIAGQVRFAREWSDLRRYAAARGVLLMGDLPLYVAADGAEVATRPDLFAPGEVSGVPPDLFSETGQLWNTPLYDWRGMRRDGFSWWIARLRRMLDLVDAVRVDHFRGLVAYWAVPQGARDARMGRWRRAPGGALLTALRDALETVPLVAEDLGIITPAVERLRRAHGLPGMVVAQFELIRGHVQAGRLWADEDRVVYTGTHDNPTALEWWESSTARQRRNLTGSLREAGIEPAEPSWSLIRLAHSAPARIAIVPAQDVLGLGREARMNRPARLEGNWRWRLEPGALTPRLAARLCEVTRETGRAGT